MENHEGNKLRVLLDELPYSKKDIGTILDMTPQNVNHHLRQPILNEDFVRLIKERLGFISLENGFSKTKLDDLKEFVKKRKMEGVKSQPAGLPVYDLSATSSHLDYVNQLPETPSYYINIPGFEDCDYCIYNYGHSMYPTIENGALLVCKKIRDKTLILYGEMYSIRTRDYLVNKRLQKSKERGKVLCLSDNDEKRKDGKRRFESFDLPIDSIIDLALIKGIFKKIQS